MVVEDRLVSNLVRAVLGKRGYVVELAEREEAAARMAASDSAVALLVTNAPGEFLEFASSVPLLYLTSQPDPLLRAAFRKCVVVLKPFAPADLVEAIVTLTAEP